MPAHLIRFDQGRTNLDPIWAPRRVSRATSSNEETAVLRRFLEVGATGFEPATFRPPAERLGAVACAGRAVPACAGFADQRLWNRPPTGPAQSPQRYTVRMVESARRRRGVYARAQVRPLARQRRISNWALCRRFVLLRRRAYTPFELRARLIIVRSLVRIQAELSTGNPAPGAGFRAFRGSAQPGAAGAGWATDRATVTGATFGLRPSLMRSSEDTPAAAVRPAPSRGLRVATPPSGAGRPGGWPGRTRSRRTSARRRAGEPSGRSA